MREPDLPFDQNKNYQKFMEVLKTVEKEKVALTSKGFVIKMPNDIIISAIHGPGAYCTEDTVEMAIIDKKTEEYIAGYYDPKAKLSEVLKNQTPSDLENVIKWVYEIYG